MAEEFRQRGSVILDAPSREIAERLSQDLQGVGALIYLAPFEGPIDFTEVHHATWGTRSDETASCIRLTSTNLRVTFGASTTDWLGNPTPHPGVDSGLSLAGVPARRIEIVDATESGAVLAIELAQPLPWAMFVPDPALTRSDGIDFEDAMRLVGQEVIANWISEDEDYWYFYFFCFGPGCTRVSKHDGVCTRISRRRP